jgi:hypothetical protein
MKDEMKDILTAIWQEVKSEDNALIVELSKKALIELENLEDTNPED